MNSTFAKFSSTFRRPSSSTSRNRSSPIIWMFCSSRIFLVHEVDDRDVPDVLDLESAAAGL